MNEKDKVKILNLAYDYLWGSLWYGSEGFVEERFDSLKATRDGEGEKGRPLLSLREKPVTAMCDQIPMLAGTKKVFTNDSSLLIRTGKKERTDFSARIESHLIFAEDFLAHEDDPAMEEDPETPVWERRCLWPNWYKRRVTETESEALRAFLAERKKTAFRNGGYNK